MHHCNCSYHHHGGKPHPTLHAQPGVDHSPNSRDSRSVDGDIFESPPQGPIGSPAMQEVSLGLSTVSSHSIATQGAADTHPGFSGELDPVTNELTPGQGHQDKRSWTVDAGNRRRVAKTLYTIGNLFGTVAYDSFDDSEFKHGKAFDYPLIPGEEHRNRDLHRIREHNSQRRDADGSVTPVLREQHSRASSFNSGFGSGIGVEGSSTIPRAAALPQSLQSPRSPSPPSAPSTLRRPHASTLPAQRTSFEFQSPASFPSAGSITGGLPMRRDTLQVPSPVYHGPMRNNPSPSSITSIVASHPRESVTVSRDPDKGPAEEIP